MEKGFKLTGRAAQIVYLWRKGWSARAIQIELKAKPGTVRGAIAYAQYHGLRKFSGPQQAVSEAELISAWLERNAPAKLPLGIAFHANVWQGVENEAF